MEIKFEVFGFDGDDLDEFIHYELNRVEIDTRNFNIIVSKSEFYDNCHVVRFLKPQGMMSDNFMSISSCLVNHMLANNMSI